MINLTRDNNYISCKGMIGTVLLCLIILFMHLPVTGHAQEHGISGDRVSGFELQVVKTQSTFAIPYRGLTAGDCFRLVCLDPGWVWRHNAVVYNGKLAADRSVGGYFSDIPLPADVLPGVYHFDLLVGVTSGGIVCFSDPRPLTIRVMTVNDTEEITVCSGTTVEYSPACLKLKQSVPEKYRWRREAVSGIREGAATGVGKISEVLTNETYRPVDVVYRYEATADACSDRGDFTLVVHVNPVIPFQITNRTLDLCSGGVSDISISPQSEDVSYSWEPEMYGSSGASAGTGTEIQQCLYYEETPGTVIYRVGVVLPEGNGCTVEQTTVVRLKVLPEIALEWTESLAPLTVGSPIRFVAYPEDYRTYQFSVNGEQVVQKESELACYDWLEGKENEITVEVASDEGCRNADTLRVMGPRLALPNWFNPLDGTRGKFMYDSQLIDFKLEVFNRNGGRLYSGREGWDGRYKGVLVPSETYLYVVHYRAPNGQRVLRKYHVYVNTGK